MLCPNCKSEIDEGSNVCPYCGIRLKNAEPPVAEAPKKTFKTAFIIVLVLFLLSVAANGVLAVAHLNQSGTIDSLQEEVENKEDDNKKAEKELKSAKKELTEVNEELDSVRSELSSTKSSLNDAKDTVSQLQYELQEVTAQANANSADDVYSDVYYMNTAGSRYFANKNVIALKVGESETVTVFLRNPGSKWSFYYNYVRTNNTSATWSENWTTDSTLTFTELRIDAGWTTGYAQLTFTNDVTSDSFDILVYVYD